MAEIAIFDVFAGLPDRRRKQGKRHSLPLCLALFTLALCGRKSGISSNRGLVEILQATVERVVWSKSLTILQYD